MNILMLPTLMQDSDVIYKFIFISVTIVCQEKAMATFWVVQKFLDKGFTLHFFLITLSLSDT